MNASKPGGRAAKPEIVFRRVPTPKPPVNAASEAAYARGGARYDRYCLPCHGIAAITGGVLPDLRRSAMLQDAGT